MREEAVIMCSSSGMKPLLASAEVKPENMGPNERGTSRSGTDARERSRQFSRQFAKRVAVELDRGGCPLAPRRL